MEKIFEKTTTPTMREVTEVRYKAIDGIMFKNEHTCISHDKNCAEWIDIYVRMNKVVPRAYNLDEMKKKLKALEKEKLNWMKAPLKDWLDYCASVYGLKEAIKIIEQKGENK